MRQRRRAGLKSLMLPLALGVSVAAAAAAGTSDLELQRELYRELHKMPPAAAFPSAETQACYDRLGKVARLACGIGGERIWRIPSEVDQGSAPGDVL